MNWEIWKCRMGLHSGKLCHTNLCVSQYAQHRLNLPKKWPQFGQRCSTSLVQSQQNTKQQQHLKWWKTCKWWQDKKWFNTYVNNRRTVNRVQVMQPVTKVVLVWTDLWHIGQTRVCDSELRGGVAFTCTVADEVCFEEDIVWKKFTWARKVK